jgi:hypothetical protein
MPKKSIDILLDKTANAVDRFLTARSSRYDDSRDFKDALFRVANDLTDDKGLRCICGKSLANIWVRTNQFGLDSLLKLQGIAKFKILDTIMMEKPTWYKEYLKREGKELTFNRFIDYCWIRQLMRKSVRVQQVI